MTLLTGFTKMNRIVKTFISNALIEMIDCKVRISLPRKSDVTLEGTQKCCGYFDTRPQFVCAMARTQKKWLSCFVHEYCHFKQWIENDPLFTTFDNTDGMQEFDNWINRTAELTKTQLHNCKLACQNLELDCEKRTVNVIIKYNLPIDVKDYIQKANAYIHFYNYVVKNRIWYNTSHDRQEILKYLPTTWMSNYNKMPTGYETAVTKYCI